MFGHAEHDPVRPADDGTAGGVRVLDIDDLACGEKEEEEEEEEEGEKEEEEEIFRVNDNQLC